MSGMFRLFGPSFVLGIGCALVDVGVLSTMGVLVDTRHTPVYGTIFAISDRLPDVFSLTFFDIQT